MAPLIEAVLAVYFEGGLEDSEIQRCVDLLSEHYPKQTTNPHREFRVDIAADTIEIKEPRQAYRLEGGDESEVILILPESISVSQMAPYKSWEIFFSRFERDLKVIRKIVDRPIIRMATRYINRIDVPLQDNIAEYEKYLSVHIALPDSIPTIGPFSIQFQLKAPEISALAVVRSGSTSPAVEGVASFSLDIDLFREVEIPQETSEFLILFQQFRAKKNELYRAFLTERALREFEE